MLDTNTFFRQATLRLCGDLEIERAMSNLLRYLSKVMPADRMFLQQFDKGLGAMRTIAHSTRTESVKADLLTPLSPDARTVVEQIAADASSGTYIFKKPRENPLSREMLLFHNVTAATLMVLMLKSGDAIVGSVTLLANGHTHYTEKHAHIFSLLKKPFAIAMSNALKHQELMQLKERLADDKRFLQSELLRMSGHEIIGANFGLRQVMGELKKVAPSDTPVLIMGETGTGKEVIANMLHASSARSNGPFIKINCGAIPESLIDSELFGHEKGAFTGALTQKRGRFERAHTGTIFLDEIGELPLAAQVRLLRVLQEKELERVGGTKTIDVDCRIIAATHRNLERMVAAGRFRKDLWFRLNVFSVVIPPLRERKADIPAFLQHFIRQKVRELKLMRVPKVAPGVVDRFLEYAWPGNVRELANVVERELILNPHGPLTFQHADLGRMSDERDVEELREAVFGDDSGETSEDREVEELREAVYGDECLIDPQVPLLFEESPPTAESAPNGAENRQEGPDNLDEAMRRHIQRILRKTGGKIHGPGGAAELLGINANTLRNRMNKLGISYGRRSR